MDDRIAILRRILDESSYTGCFMRIRDDGRRGGFVGVKYADKAYDIEKEIWSFAGRDFHQRFFTIPVRSSFLIFTKRK